MEKIKEFFINLYDKFMGLSFVQLAIDYCKENPLMAGLIGGLLLFIIVILCIIGGLARKAKKAAKKAAAKDKAEFSIEEVLGETETPEPVEATLATETAEAPKAPETETAEETKAEEVAEVPTETPAPESASDEEEVGEASTETPVTDSTPDEEEVGEASTETPVTDSTPDEEEAAPAPVEETKATEPAPVEERKNEETEKAEETQKKPTQAEDASETLAMAEDIDDEDDDVLRDHYDENETDRIARYKGKWVICRVITDEEDCEEMYFFELHASNGERLLESEEYTSYQGALRGIQTHKTNILKGNFKITMTKKGDYIFKLLSGKNMLLCMGENYPTKARCESAVDSTIRFAATAIIDENVQDIVIKVPHEDDSPVEPLPENCTGKWIISTGSSVEGQKIYYFELFANNGERLLESEEYTTYIGAVNGIQTHKKNIDKNNFRITLTKRGDYIYKLLNGNGQLLCLGEHYRTKRLCQNAVESVKRFAMNSPILTDDDNVK